MSPILCRAALLLAAALLCFTSAQAQRANRGPIISSDSDASRSSDQPSPMGSPEQEMLVRSAIARSESAHRANLQRARENSELATELRAAYENSRMLNRNDLRKLERMERLVRRIRSEAGGSDGEARLEEMPANLEAALKQLAESSEALREDVENTSRFVVSASIIERANDLLELIRITRAFVR